MPIQITELNISVSVTQPGTPQQQGAAPQAPEKQEKPEDVVESCVDQVIRILNDKKER